MKKILTIIVGAMFLSGCSTLSQKQDSPTSLKQNNQSNDDTFKQRMKLARKPYSYVSIDYMDVASGKEELYLEVERSWEKIHQKLTEEGKILGWGLAKARKNKFDYEYITWKLVRSRGDLDRVYDFDAIKQSMGDNKFDNLMSKTMESRIIVGNELLALEDYTLPPLSGLGEKNDPNNLYFHFFYMTPTEGKDQEYIEMEKNVFQPRHQKMSELTPGFLSWRLYRKIADSGRANETSYRTLHFHRKDAKPLSNDEQQKVNLTLPAFPKDLKFEDVMAMRKVERVTFDVILMTDSSKNAEAEAWKELVGTWTATNENGSYRTKTISPYTEQIKMIDSSGELIHSGRTPMSIEIKNGLKFFSAHWPNGTYTSIFKIHNDKWYEQTKNILSSNSGKPDIFYIYERSDKPATIDRSAFTKKGEDVGLVKAIIENYAAGKIDEYLALFTEDAKVTHNNNEPITISELTKIHRAHHEQIAGPVKILSSNYEVVTTANGNKYGHAWIKFENTYKNGSKAVTPVFVSFGINNKGKIYFEHALYDTATVPDDSVYNKN